MQGRAGVRGKGRRGRRVGTIVLISDTLRQPNTHCYNFSKILYTVTLF